MEVEPGLAQRLSVGALVRAWRRSRRIHRMPSWEALLRQVRTGRYRPGRPRILRIPKPGGGVRRLTVPPIRDRVLQRAILDVLPSHVRRVRPQVHGYVRGRSPHTGVRQLVEHVGRRTWLEVIQADLTDLFDELDHGRLERVLHTRWPDPLFLRLCMTWARAYGSAGRGVGQGSPLSPLMANAYLHQHLDPVVAGVADAGWLRYGDDVTAASTRRGGALGMFAALEWAGHVAGLRVAMRKVAVCVAPTGGRLKVLGHDVQLRPCGDGWQLIAKPSRRSRLTTWVEYRDAVGSPIAI